jgi:murein DD-endopeptidase MepM/ murein hydrolase activator NlpD
VNDPSAFTAVLRDLQVILERQDETVETVAGLREERDEQAEDTARARGIAMQTSLDATATLEVVEALRDVAAGVAAEIETDVRRQRELLDSLELTESEAAQLVERASAREVELEEQLERTRERERREEEERRRAEQAARERAEEAARQRAEEAARQRAEEAQRRAEEAAQRAADEAAQQEADEAAQREAGEAAQREAREAAQRGAAVASSGGAGRRSAAAGAAGGPPLGGLVCPVAGAVAGRDFSNDWGYPRSGGRTHQGNDIFADRGTRVVAVDAGEVVRTTPASAPTRLGGITVTYETADGSQWYNAHLDTIAAGIEVGARVQRGQTIGTVGNTGNARATPPHLHLGRRVAGGWVNPWPTVSGACR